MVAAAHETVLAIAGVKWGRAAAPDCSQIRAYPPAAAAAAPSAESSVTDAATAASVASCATSAPANSVSVVAMRNLTAVVEGRAEASCTLASGVAAAVVAAHWAQAVQVICSAQCQLGALVSVLVRWVAADAAAASPIASGAEPPAPANPQL
jgi:hypothetical protein